jgi:hypothetical protein
MSLRRPTHTLWARCSKNGRGNVTRLVKTKPKIQIRVAGVVRGKCRRCMLEVYVTDAEE